MHRGRPARSSGRGRSTGRGRAKSSETDHLKVGSSTVTSAPQFTSDPTAQLQSRRRGGQPRGRGRGEKRSASTANIKHNTIGEPLM